MRGDLFLEMGAGRSHPFPLTGSCLSQQALNNNPQDKKALSHCFLGEQDWKNFYTTNVK